MSLGWAGSECAVTKPVSSGFMALTIVDWEHGVRFLIFKPVSTQAAWNNCPERHYKVNEVTANVFTIDVPYRCKISRNTYINVIREMHRLRSNTRVIAYDNAGPHSGRAVSLAYRAANYLPVCGEFGGCSSVSQMADAEEIHGSLKGFVRRKVAQHYLSSAKESKEETGRAKAKVFTLSQLCSWLDEWATNHGSPSNVRHLFPKYFPPLPGMRDERKDKIKESIRFAIDNNAIENRRLAIKSKKNKQTKSTVDTTVTVLRGVGKKCAAKLMDVGVKTLGDLMQYNGSPISRVNVRMLRGQAADILSGAIPDPLEKNKNVACERCGQVYSGRTPSFHKHKANGCFMNFVMPFLPKPKSQCITNNDRNYRGRRCRIKLSVDGCWVNAVFSSPTRISYMYNGEIKTFDGDWRDFTATPVWWIA